MSIILKGIDMPKEGELRLIISKNGMICGAEYPKVRHAYPLNLDAEAIQIPTPHGRLIDAKVFADTICQAIQSGDLIQKSIWEWIADAPTILEAEE